MGCPSFRTGAAAVLNCALRLGVRRSILAAQDSERPRERRPRVKSLEDLIAVVIGSCWCCFLAHFRKVLSFLHASSVSLSYPERYSDSHTDHKIFFLEQPPPSPSCTPPNHHLIYNHLTYIYDRHQQHPRTTTKKNSATYYPSLRPAFPCNHGYRVSKLPLPRWL